MPAPATTLVPTSALADLADAVRYESYLVGEMAEAIFPSVFTMRALGSRLGTIAAALDALVPPADDADLPL